MSITGNSVHVVENKLELRVKRDGLLGLVRWKMLMVRSNIFEKLKITLLYNEITYCSLVFVFSYEIEKCCFFGD